jgi:hypothetical protein
MPLSTVCFDKAQRLQSIVRPNVNDSSWQKRFFALVDYNARLGVSAIFVVMNAGGDLACYKRVCCYTSKVHQRRPLSDVSA